MIKKLKRWFYYKRNLEIAIMYYYMQSKSLPSCTSTDYARENFQGLCTAYRIYFGFPKPYKNMIEYLKAKYPYFRPTLGFSIVIRDRFDAMLKEYK